MLKYCLKQTKKTFWLWPFLFDESSKQSPASPQAHHRFLLDLVTSDIKEYYVQFSKLFFEHVASLLLGGPIVTATEWVEFITLAMGVDQCCDFSALLDLQATVVEYSMFMYKLGVLLFKEACITERGHSQ